MWLRQRVLVAALAAATRLGNRRQRCTGVSGAEPSCCRLAQPLAGTPAQRWIGADCLRDRCFELQHSHAAKPITLRCQRSGPVLTGDWDGTDTRLPR